MLLGPTLLKLPTLPTLPKKRRWTKKNAESGGNFVPSKKASPQFTNVNEEQPQAVLCFLVVAQKNAESRMNARNTRKLPPQFTNVNEEGVCRSMTKQSPAIVHFLQKVGDTSRYPQPPNLKY